MKIDIEFIEPKVTVHYTIRDFGAEVTISFEERYVYGVRFESRSNKSLGFYIEHLDTGKEYGWITLVAETKEEIESISGLSYCSKNKETESFVYINTCYFNSVNGIRKGNYEINNPGLLNNIMKEKIQ